MFNCLIDLTLHLFHIELQQTFEQKVLQEHFTSSVQHFTFKHFLSYKNCCTAVTCPEIRFDDTGVCINCIPFQQY